MKQNEICGMTVGFSKVKITAEVGNGFFKVIMVKLNLVDSKENVKEETEDHYE